MALSVVPRVDLERDCRLEPALMLFCEKMSCELAETGDPKAGLRNARDYSDDRACVALMPRDRAIAITPAARPRMQTRACASSGCLGGPRPRLEYLHEAERERLGARLWGAVYILPGFVHQLII